MTEWCVRAGTFALLATLGGCGLPVSTLHGPVPVAPGQMRIGAGVGPVFLEEPDEFMTVGDMLIMGLYAGARAGLTDRLEVGGSAGMWNGFAGDLKFVAIRAPVSVAGNLSVSVNPLMPEMLGVHPAVLAGTDRLYGGGKLMLYPAGDVPMSMSVLFVGASLGGRTRLVPELARVRERGDPTVIWVAGVALQHTVDGLDLPLGIPFWRAP